MRSIIAQLFVEPEEAVLTGVRYKDILEERKGKVVRLLHNASKDGNLYCVERCKIILKSIDKQIIRVLSNEIQNIPIYSRNRVSGR